MISDTRQLYRRLSNALLERIQSADRSGSEKVGDLRHLRQICEHVDVTETLLTAADLLLKQFPEDTQAEREVALALNCVRTRLSGTALPAFPSGKWLPYGATSALSEREVWLFGSQASAARKWPFPECFSDSWKDLTGHDLGQSVDLVLRAVPEKLNLAFHMLMRTCSAARDVQLDFYPGYRLVEFLIEPPGAPTRSVLFLMGPSDCIQMTGESGIIHAFNQSGGLQLQSDSAVRQYLIFFCAMVHGEGGPFTIVTDYSVIADRWTGEGSPQQEKLNLKPLRIAQSSDETSGKSWRCEPQILYSGVLFEAVMEVTANGSVRMTDDSARSNPMPVMRERFRHGWRVLVDDEEIVAT